MCLVAICGRKLASACGRVICVRTNLSWADSPPPRSTTSAHTVTKAVPVMRPTFTLRGPLQYMHMSKPHLTVLLPWVVLLVFSAGCRSNSSPPPSPAVPPPPPANAWAIVNGHTITQEDVDKAYRRTSNAAQVLSDEETMTAKLSLLNDLIVQELLLARAGVLKVEVPQTELDAAFKDAEKNIADAAFRQELKQRGLTTEDMREGLRRELLCLLYTSPSQRDS